MRTGGRAAGRKVRAFSCRTRPEGLAEDMEQAGRTSNVWRGSWGWDQKPCHTVQGGMDVPQLWLEGQGKSLGVWPLGTFQPVVCSLGWEGSWGGGWPGSMLALLLAPHLPGLSGLSAFGERGSKGVLRKPGFFHLT